MKRLVNKLNKNKIEIIVVLIVLMQNPFWPFWMIGTKLSFVFITFLFVVLKIKKRIIIEKKQALPLFLLAISFLVLPLVRGGLHLSSFLYVLCFVIAYSLRCDESKRCLEVLSKIFGAVVAVSLPAWLLHVTGIFSFPLIGTIDIGSLKVADAEEGGIVMNNYFFFVMRTVGSNMFRFYSVFDEPGVLGTIGAYLLFSQHYDLSKWYNISLFLGCCFSLSFAFYVLCIVGYLGMSIKTITGFIRMIGIVVIALLLTSSILLQFEYFYDYIISRGLSISESLNERTAESVHEYMKNMGIFEYLIGIGANQIVEKGLDDGASYKLFILENGFISLLCLIFIYTRTIRKWSWEVVVFNVVFWLSFLQRPTAFMAWQIFMFIMITYTVLDRNTEKYKVKTV